MNNLKSCVQSLLTGGLYTLSPLADERRMWVYAKENLKIIEKKEKKTWRGPFQRELTVSLKLLLKNKNRTCDRPPAVGML